MGQPEQDPGRVVRSPDITALLWDLEASRPQAWDRLVEAAYPELHRIASWHCRRERSSATLQCTAIVNEAWIRLAQAQHATWKGRTHFFAFASRLMRSILIDYARAKKSAKRGGGAPVLSLIDTDGSATGAAAAALDVDILELNEALEELEKLDPLQGRIVELQYFSGLTTPETAEALGISESNIKREWTIAKTWIRRRMLEGRSAS